MSWTGAAQAATIHYEPGKLYWWKAADKERVLCRLIQETGGYVSLRILGATNDQIIRFDKGPGELVHLDKRTAPLERATV